MWCFNKITHALKLEYDHNLSLIHTEHDKGITVEPVKTLGTVKVSYGCEVFEQDTRLHVEADEVFLGLYFVLDNDLNYSFPNHELPPDILYKNHYNLIYLPRIKYDCLLKRGVIKTFAIEFPLDFFAGMEDAYPILRPFLDNVKNQVACTLSARHLYAAVKIHRSVMNLLLDNREEIERDIFFNATVIELTGLCLQDITEAAKVRPRETFSAKTKKAMELVCKHPEYKWTLGLLSEKVDLEVRKLTRLFRLMYNKSVMQALMEARMKKALLLLRDDNIPLLKVARATGYRSQSNFSQAFKKFFGKTPSEMRSRIR